jgi:tripartite-type tricarboxylate transporter receptor subunit TctC
MPVSMVARAPLFLAINPNVPAKSLKELIDYAKANPGKLNYASVGIGSSAHLATVLMMDVTGIKMQHVPYSQMSQGINDLISGRTEISFGPMGSSMPNIRAGKMRALAISGLDRAKLLPEIPTLTEVGIKMSEESSWYGFFAPKGTPKAVIAKVNKDVQTVLDMPDMRERETQLGYRFIGGSPDKLAAFLKSEIEKWDRLGKKGAFQTN